MDLNDTLTPEFCDIANKIKESELTAEVIATALLEMKEYPKSSPLLALQIAMEDWDI